MLALERDAAGEPRARQIEHVVDQPAHALAARQHRGAAMSLGSGPSERSFEQLRGGHDGAQRIAQIVAEHGGEHLVQAQRLGALLAARWASCCFCR